MTTTVARVHRGLAWAVGRPAFWVALVVLLFAQPIVRVLMREQPVLPPVGARLPEFTLERELGRPLGTRELRGKVWVAHALPSDPARRQRELDAMWNLQKRLRKLGDAVRLLTIAPGPLDAAHLTDLARTARTNPHVWAFVRGADADRLLPALPPGAFAVVDGEGRLRGAYDATRNPNPDDERGPDALVRDVGLLVNNY